MVISFASAKAGGISGGPALLYSRTSEFTKHLQTADASFLERPTDTGL